MNSTHVNFSHLSDDFLKSEIEAEQKAINEKSTRVALMQNELEQREIKNAPFKIGDRVCKTDNPSYQWDITRIISLPVAKENPAQYQFIGIPIKKDGTPYKHKSTGTFSCRSDELSLVK